jgi:hypothetical protein
MGELHSLQHEVAAAVLQPGHDELQRSFARIAAEGEGGVQGTEVIGGQRLREVIGGQRLRRPSVMKQG